jgi:hypothetical protein
MLGSSTVSGCHTPSISSPEGSEALSDDGVNESGFYVQLSDLEVLLAPPKAFENATVRDYCVARTRFKHEHIVKRLNGGMRALRSIWPDATAIELYVGFEMCEESLDDLVESLSAEGFRGRVREEAERRLAFCESGCFTFSEGLSSGSSVANGEVRDVRGVVGHADGEADADDDCEDDDDSDFVCTGEPEIGFRSRRRARVRPGEGSVSGSSSVSGGSATAAAAALLPCPREVSASVWAQWSSARKTSYYQAKDHPNSYFYRHLPPGEVQRNGAWTAEEKRLFMSRMRELRGTATTFGHDWGLFSRTIPGRVGYQCSNFYRALLESGEMQDSRYVRGSDGRLHHTSRQARETSSCPRKSRKSRSDDIDGDGDGDGDDEVSVSVPRRRRQTGRSWRSEVERLTIESIESLRFVVGFGRGDGGGRGRGSGGCERLGSGRSEFGFSGDWGGSGSGVYCQDEDVDCVSGKSRYEMWAMQNPLPDAIDFITGEVMRVPAISPDGYVLDYRTWVESLSEKAVNPFTQNRLTKRQLVILTIENFQEYADKIVNLKDN